jgi:hypothetical protein
MGGTGECCTEADVLGVMDECVVGVAGRAGEYEGTCCRNGET